MEQLKNKKILITGASGFIGRNLAKKLHEAGAIVYGTSRDKKTNNKRLTWLRCSFENFNDTKDLLEKVKPDIIYHLSGEVTASGDFKLILPTYHSLLTSTVNILTAASALQCERILLAGSCTEPAGLNGAATSPYAAAKHATRTYGDMFYECYQTPVVVIRPFFGYGPGQSDEKLIPYAIHSFLENKNPELSNGKLLCDWIYIDDLIEGIINCTIAPGIEGHTIDLGTGSLTSVKDVVLKLKKITRSKAKPLFGFLPDRNEQHTRLANIEQTFRKLKWKAKVSLNEGLLKTVNTYKNRLANISSLAFQCLFIAGNA